MGCEGIRPLMRSSNQAWPDIKADDGETSSQPRNQPQAGLKKSVPLTSHA